MSLLWYHAFLISLASASLPMCWRVKGRERESLEVTLTVWNPHSKQPSRIPGNKHSNMQSAYHLSLRSTSEMVVELRSKFFCLFFLSVPCLLQPKAQWGLSVRNVMGMYDRFVLWQSTTTLTTSDIEVTGPIRVKWHSCADKWIIMWEPKSPVNPCLTFNRENHMHLLKNWHLCPSVPLKKNAILTISFDQQKIF